MKRFLILWVLLCCLVPCWAQADPTLYRMADREKMQHWVDSVFLTLDEDAKIGQLFMPIADLGMSEQNKRRLLRLVHEVKIGGVLFHKGNTRSQAMLTNLMQEESSVPHLWCRLMENGDCQCAFRGQLVFQRI